MPRLGAAGLATVIAPSRRNAAVVIDESQLSVIIPGCHQRQPGVYLCETSHEYQHCRTLLRAGKIFSCRAGLAFDGNFADPYPADPDEYLLDVRSDAEIRVEPGRRGEGRVRGEATALIQFMPPAAQQGVWCLQRDRYVYHYTGPRGGLGEISDTQSCETPIELSFEPHDDNVLMAYDACASFAAWGSELEEEMDVLVSALFQIGSASPKFLQEHGASTTIVAPYVIVKAPVRIECRE